MKHLLKLSDLTSDEIFSLLDLADKLKYEKKHGIPHPILAGKTLGMIFQKSSTRTRVSFECGMYQLGGSALFLSSRDLQIGRGEPVEDTARVLSRYLDGIMIRTFEQAEVEALAEYGTIPVINGLTDYCHPCQVLADLQTVREHKGTTEGKKLCFIGDGNNMANSLIVGGIGVMTVMLVAVNERKREIGLKKAIGATRRDILLEFIIEAIAISLFGGAVGIGLSYLLSAFSERLIGIEAAPNLTISILSLLFCAIIGIIFSVYPARKAAALDPIDCLKYE